MTAWRDRVDELLYSGESVETSRDVGGTRVVVTSHRVLVLSPDGSEARFRQVDRPNVDGIRTAATGNAWLLGRSVTVGVVGSVLVAVGLTFDFGSLVGGVELPGGSAIGGGGIVSTMESLLGLLARLDDMMRIAGAAGLLLAVVLLGIYWIGREKTLVIEVAGDDDVELPRPVDADATVATLREAIEPGGQSTRRPSRSTRES